jgi:microcystin-dependent protein
MGMQYMGEIRIMSFNYAPKGWAQCNGQTMSISQNQALFALLGTTYGGDGITTFCLPDLRTRVPGSTSQSYTLGAVLGEYAHTLLPTEIPQHIHFLKTDATSAANGNLSTAATGNSFGQNSVSTSGGSPVGFNMYSPTLTPTAQMAPQALGFAGGSQPHENRQPFLVLNICIAMQGIFPSRN